MRQPLVLEDVAADPRFARDVAQATGYVPKGLMAAPLLHEERALGVLSVLDRPQRAGFSLAELDLLGQFAHQAAIALDLLVSARRVARILDGQDDRLQAVAALARAVEGLGEGRDAAAARLLAALTDVLRDALSRRRPAAANRVLPPGRVLLPAHAPHSSAGRGAAGRA